MIEFFRKLFGAPGSSQTAKDRLRIVLMSDHLALAPEIVEQMKRDFIDVISKYVEVDREHIDVRFEQEDRALALMANVPIISVNRPPSGGNKVEQKPVAAPAALVAAPESGAAGTTGTAPTTANGLPKRRRRRRKNPGGATQTLPAPS